MISLSLGKVRDIVPPIMNTYYVLSTDINRQALKKCIFLIDSFCKMVSKAVYNCPSYRALYMKLVATAMKSDWKENILNHGARECLHFISTYLSSYILNKKKSSNKSNNKFFFHFDYSKLKNKIYFIKKRQLQSWSKRSKSRAGRRGQW